MGMTVYEIDDTLFGDAPESPGVTVGDSVFPIGIEAVRQAGGTDKIGVVEEIESKFVVTLLPVWVRWPNGLLANYTTSAENDGYASCQVAPVVSDEELWE